MSQIVVPKPTPIKEPEKVASVVDNKPQKLISVAKEAWPSKQEINQSQPQQSILTTRINKNIIFGYSLLIYKV
jgi:hypothetical protein